MKFGIFGGTFDPVHNGHLIVAEYVRESISLDRILFVPTLITPNKRDAGIASARDRFAMLREGVKANPFFEVSGAEIERGGISYTVDTLRFLKEKHPADSLFLLVGADNLAEFPTWKEPAEILRCASVVAITRPGFPAAANETALTRGFISCRVPAIEVSATEIRRRIRHGLPISYLVPPAVEKYIGRHRLYRGETEPPEERVS